MRRLFYSDAHGVGTSFGLLLVRVVMGAAFMFHGWPKIQNPTNWLNSETTDVHGALQAAAAVSEFVGGGALILGLFSRLAALGTGITMAVAIGIVHLALRDPFVAAPGKSSWESAAIYLACSILILLAGPGRFSLDALLFRQRAPVEPATA
jgi:putative oxidoreductase